MMKLLEFMRVAKFSIAASMFLCLLLFFCFSSSHANQINPAEISQTIENIQKMYAVAAVSVLVVRQDEVLFNLHSGLRDWDSKQPFSSHDMYRIGSISKSFAGMLALRLEQKGLIDLNDSIVDYGLAPYLINSFPEQAITLAQLLEHTAGLKDLTKAEWDYNDSKPISLKQAFDLKLGMHKTLWPPGMHRSYSNVGPGLFGLALELKLGKSYEALMQKHVFEPLNMSHSSLMLTTEVRKHLITGYNRDGKTPIPYWHNIYRPFAAINTNNQDMIHWLQMLLKQDNAFLSQTDRKRLIEPTTTLAAMSGLNFGYGLGVYQWQVDGHSFYGHGGDADGFLTRFGFNSELGLAYFVMINAFNHQPLNQIVNLLEQQITADLSKPKYPTRLKQSSEQLDGLVGFYQQVTARFSAGSKPPKVSIEIFVQDDILFYRHNNGPATAIYKVINNQFRTVNDSVATMAFIEDQGKLYFQSPLGNFVKVYKKNAYSVRP